jgi:MFS family permease
MTLARVPQAVWVLGFVSLLMDISSEMIHSLLPVFMVTVLGASALTVGIVEGLAEATALIVKVFSGTLSDYLGRRKPLAVLGYGLGAISKPLFAIASTSGMVLAARFIDRVGKGIRGAPRDALVADLVPPELRGAAYGLRQALDSVGAFLGPVRAVACMAWFAGNVKATLWIAFIPGLIAVSLLAAGIREPDRERVAAPARSATASRPRSRAGLAGALAPFGLSALKRLGLRFWMVALLGAVFSLARFSEAFLVLRAQSVGLPMGRVPIVMILMNLVYASAAYPAGAAADRMNKRTLLMLGLAVLIAADFVLARAASAGGVYLGALLWGSHMALTQGLFAKLVADACPADLRGSAFGVFNLIGGLSLLAASVIAGALWQRFGAEATFLVGAGFAALTALGLLGYRNNKT